jgi:carbon-monoxide dehydrogenase medium subunit
MLLNLKTIHKPATLEEAITQLATPGTYPLYGGVALQRSSNPAVEAAVNLEQLKLNFVKESDATLLLGSMLTLEQARKACLERAEKYPNMGTLAAILGLEMPEAQRNTMTIGDLLMERDPQSLTLTLFLALGVVLQRVDVAMHLTAAAWLLSKSDVTRYLISDIRVVYGAPQSAIAWEKVARTPADAPIVGVVVYVEGDENHRPSYCTLALCGVAPTPVRQPEVERVLIETGSIDAALDHLELDPPDDHWGSRDYRVEMARVVSRRALAAAIEKTAGSNS